MKSKKQNYSFPVLIEKDESGYFVGTVPSLKSCYTQAKTLPQLFERLEEVIELCLEIEEKQYKNKVPKNEFIGVQMVELAK
ncbi:MAG: type II toxin-antitoxin system HicB family antitoxin [Patescibacteria group bacterium]